MIERLRGLKAALFSLVGMGSIAPILEAVASHHEPVVPTPKHDVAAAMRYGAAKWATWTSAGAPNRAMGKGPSRRRERREGGITARQQRLQRQREPGKPHDRIDARRAMKRELHKLLLWLERPPSQRSHYALPAAS